MAVLALVVLVGAVAMFSLWPASDASTRTAAEPSPSASSASPAPTATPTPTAAPTPYDAKVELVTCPTLGWADDETYDTVQETWSSDQNIEGLCSIRMNRGGTLTQTQEQALQTAYGTVSAPRLANLYAICTTRSNMDAGSTVPVDTQEVTGALILCPDHPGAETIRKNIGIRNAIAAGEQVSDGHYLVGTDVQAGTWQSVGPKVTDCYWEVSDAQGNIIDNSFISTAPQLTIDIPAGAAGFTVQGCTFQRLA